MRCHSVLYHLTMQTRLMDEFILEQVLSDAHKRAIYDALGVKGLETEGWEIVHRTKTPNEIREEYERLAREREERRLQQRTNPRGNITINVNATEIFDSYQDELE